MKKIIKFLKAFSLVEMMVNIIAISVLVAAMAPVITKKIEYQRAIVDTTDIMTQEKCTAFTNQCTLCTTNECLVCQRACGEKETSFGETSMVLNAKQCKCVLCNADTSAITTASMMSSTVTTDKYCYSCTLGKSKCNKCMSGYYLSSSTVCTECQAGRLRRECRRSRWCGS